MLSEHSYDSKSFEVSEQKLRGHISDGTEARTQTKVAHTSLFPISSLLDARSIFTQCGRKDLAWRCPVKRVFSVPGALEKEFTFFSHSTGAMSGLRRHFNMGLVLLMCALTGHCGESAPSAAPVVTAAAAAGRDAQQDLRRIVEIMKHVEESRGLNGMKTEAPLISRDGGSAGEPKDLRNLKTDRGEKAVAVFPRDLRKKEKFLKHITGPLYFSPKCRKHVYRLYHHTRDCTIPAYFKRCARLLTRLAGSPQCTEG